MASQQFDDRLAIRKRKAAGALGGALLAVFVLGVLNPLQAEIEALQAEIVHLDRRLAAARQRATVLDVRNAELAETRAKIQSHLRRVSVSQDMSSLRRAVDAVAHRCGLTVSHWRSEPNADSGGQRQQIATVPVTLRVVGRYHQVAWFLESLFQESGIRRVDSLTMQAAGNDPDGKIVETDLRLLGMIASAPFLATGT